MTSYIKERAWDRGQVLGNVAQYSNLSDVWKISHKLYASFYFECSINQCICFCFAQLGDWVAVTLFHCRKNLVWQMHFFKNIYIFFTVKQQVSSYYFSHSGDCFFLLRELKKFTGQLGLIPYHCGSSASLVRHKCEQVESDPVSLRVSCHWPVLVQFSPSLVPFYCGSSMTGPL